LMAAYAASAAGPPEIIENIRNVYFIFINGDTGLDSTAAVDGRGAADNLAALGYEHFYMEYLGRAHSFSLVAEAWPITTGLLRDRKRDPNPAHITYTMKAAHEVPALGLVHDHNYWVSGLALAQGAASGTIDAFALPLSGKLPTKASRLTGYFTNTQTLNNVYVSWLEYRDLTGHSITDYQSGWVPLNVTVSDVPMALPPKAGSNGFASTTTGLSSATFDLQRMGIVTAGLLHGDVTTDVAQDLTLLSDSAWPNGVIVRVDGRDTQRILSGRALTVHLDSGTHAVDIGA
ncbi:MAG: hypothetical protein ACRETN_08315, partial [Nevskiales bacterium]